MDEDAACICEDIVLLSQVVSIARIPPIHILAESWHLPNHTPNFAFDFDLSTLVSTQQAHEMQWVFNSVRTQLKYDASDAPSEEKEGRHSNPSTNIPQMNAVLKEEQDWRINTGAKRKTTWMASAPGGCSNEEILLLVGNSADADWQQGREL